MIRKLESAGLGFYTSASETRDRIGHIPMRQLVYRVQPLPTSLQPLVWDFGQLDATVERAYIHQLVKGMITSVLPALRDDEIDLIMELLAVSQNFMRQRKDECSFVSIRDIERCLRVCQWFVTKSKLVFSRMNSCRGIPAQVAGKLSDLMRAVFLSLMVCYHSCLFDAETRYQYRKLIMQHSGVRGLDGDWLADDLNRCQTVFVDEIDIDKKNKVMSIYYSNYKFFCKIMIFYILTFIGIINIARKHKI